VWKTSYLHTNGEFANRLPSIRSKLLDAFSMVDDQHFHLISARRESTMEDPSETDQRRFNLRTVEFHEYRPGGQLKRDLHYDAGSFITMDVMLANPGEDFSGGELATPNIGAREENTQRKYTPVEQFEKGDAAFFLSHKYHNVLPVTAGKRTVLVVELWEGPEKSCPHRCLTTGPCKHSLTKSQIDGFRQHLAILG